MRFHHQQAKQEFQHLHAKFLQSSRIRFSYSLCCASRAELHKAHPQADEVVVPLAIATMSPTPTTAATIYRGEVCPGGEQKDGVHHAAESGENLTWRSLR